MLTGLYRESPLRDLVESFDRRRSIFIMATIGGTVGRVKAVLSGDTIVLTSIVEGSTAERTLSFAYVTAPRLRREGDEPHAWSSRNSLLTVLVGKVVQFKVLYEIPTTKRQFGIVWIEDVLYPQECVRNGCAEVRDSAGRKDDPEETAQLIEELRDLEKDARAERLGIWNQNDDGIIDVQNDVGNPAEFMKNFKNQTVKAQVERVISGDRALIRVWASDKKHYNLMALIAGIKAPSTARVNQETQQTTPGEPFAEEARHFVERRLLQRRVDFTVVGLSPQNQVIGILKHPKGDVGVLLNAAGLAEPLDYHSTMVGPYMKEIRDAKAFAQEQKNGMWRNYVKKTVDNSAATPATAIRVFSADTIFVKTSTIAEKRLNISSIRGPRQNEASEAPFRDAAKEFLRKKLIGKQIRFIIDGKKAANGEYEEKEVATVLLNDTNINLLLVQEGWASVIRHRRDDTDRAPNYDDLLAAQEEAQTKKKGMWSPKAPAVKTYVDASENIQKAKMNVAGLQRQKKIPAIVDYVKGGGRFTVLVPKEGVKLNFVLGGIRAPKSARNASEQGEPFGQEAHEFAARHLNQRDVEINVHNTDKIGGFIGEIFVNRVSFAKMLVEEGLATVHDYSAQQSGNYEELSAAQQRAKENRKHMWQNWDPSQDVEEEETGASNWATAGKAEAAPAQVKKDLKQVKVAHVAEDGKLKIQVIGQGTSALSTLINQFKAFHLSGSNNVGLPADPKNGDFVSAKDPKDGQWHRGRIRANDRTAKVADVQFIDFGHKVKIPWKELRPLGPQFSAQKLKAQAEDSVLSLIQLPVGTQYTDEALDFIHELTSGKELVANFDLTDREGVHHITLFMEGANVMDETVNVQLAGEGLATVPKKLKQWEESYTELLEELRLAQDYARENRKGIFEYGDLTEDD